MRNMRKSIVFALTGAMAVGLSSCHIYQKYDLPTDNAIVSDYARAVAETPDSTSLGYLEWEQIFTDPQLQALIRQALENNADLDNAMLNVDIARAQLKGAKLSYFPSLALTPNGGTSSYGGSHMNWTYTIPLAASWEIDAFAKILNRKRGAQVAVEQAEAYAQAARSQIVCGVATSYYTLVLLNQQLDLTKRTSEIWADQVESMKLLKEAGRTNEAAVVQSQANYYSIMASIPDLEQQITTVQNSLSLLLNTYPQTWSVSSSLDFSLPVEVTSGIPLNYLATRPDVAAAERGMAAAFYSLNSARTNFYPSLVISAQGGFTNLLGSMISNPGKWFIQLAGSLTAPIFSRGQNIATYEAAKAQQKQAVNNFEKVVLSAAGDVSNALVAINQNTAKRAMIEKQIDALEKSVEYTNELFMYNQGTTYLEVLTARSSLLQAQLAALACWHTKATSLISLYQAVGGGR